MRAVVQRVSSAKVSIAGQVHGQIETGFMVLLGVGPHDTVEDVNYLVHKISKLRVFSDPEGKMNLSLTDIGGSVLAISQFTLYADTKKGNRPSFVQAAAPELGKKLYETFISRMQAAGIPVETGVFGADMQVALVNDGPVTICLDTEAK